MNLEQAQNLESVLADKIAVSGGTLIVNVVLWTQVGLKKGTKHNRCPYELWKCSVIRGKCLMGQTAYQTFVRNARRRENIPYADEFVALPPSGKRHISDMILQNTNPHAPLTHYLATYFMRNNSHTATSYWTRQDGEWRQVELSAPEYEPWLTSELKKKLDGTYVEGSPRQGLPPEKRVIIRTPKVEAFKAVRCGDYEHRDGEWFAEHSDLVPEGFFPLSVEGGEIAEVEQVEEYEQETP
jgi:hypothetical protein